MSNDISSPHSQSIPPTTDAKFDTFCRAIVTARGNVLGTLRTAPGRVAIIFVNHPDLPGIEFDVSDIRNVAAMLQETADALESEGA